MKKSYLFTLLFFHSFFLLSQNKTYLGYEVGLTKDIYSISDKENIKPVSQILGSWGIYLGHQMNEHFKIETGLIRKFSQSFEVKSPYTFQRMGLGGYNNWQIPIKLNYSLNLYRNKVFFTPAIGYHICTNPSRGQNSYGYMGSISLSDTASMITNHTSINSKVFSLLETKIGFEFVLFDKCNLGFFASYFNGFKNISQFDVIFEKTNELYKSGSLSNKGNYWKIGLILSCPLGTSWFKGGEAL